MSAIAEAFVRLRPDFSTFRAEATAGVAAQLGTLEGSATAGLASVTAGTAGVTAGLTAIEREAIRAGGITTASTREMTSGLIAVEAQAIRTAGAVAAVPAGATTAAASSGAAFLGMGAGALRATGGIIGITSAATAAAIAIRGIASITAQTEEQLNVLQEVTGATAAEMDRISDTATELGADLTLPGVSAADAALAMNELAKAGLSIKDTMGGAKGVLQLATAGEIEVGEAAALAGSALNVFSLEGTRAVDVADLLAGASVAAQGSVGDMALALQQSGAVARQAGLTLEQTVGAIGLLAKNGILGSDAGTSLRTTLLRLIPTTKEAAQFVKALGIEIDEERTLGEQLPEVIEQYRTALNRLNPALQQQALTQIFGTDAIRAASIFAREGADGLDEMTAAVNRQGAAADLAAARTEGLGGSYGNLQSQLETLGLELGEVLSPAVQALLDGASDLTAQVNDYIQATKDIEAQTEDIVRDLIEIGDAALGAADKWKQAVDDFLGFELKLPEFPELPNVPGFPETPEPPDLIPFKNQLEEIRGLVDDPFGAVKEQATRGIPVVGQFKIVEQAAKRAQDAIDAAGNATGTFDLPELPKINGELKSLRDSMTDLRSPDVIDRAAIIAQGGEARRAGAALGQEIGKGLTEGIEDEQETAVEAARRNVREVAAAGREAVADAIRQAQRNLASLGSELASQATAVLDASGPERRIEQLEDEAAAAAANAQRGRLRAAVTTAQANLEEALRNAPVERRIRELQESLARDERGAGRVDLNRSLRDAREALREAQSQAQVAGDLDPRQRAQTARFLRPFREAVADAKGDIKTFNKEATIESLQAKLTGQTDAITENINGLRDALTGARQALVDSQKEFATKGLIDSLRKTATAQKLAVEQGIADSIQAFNDGLITLPELNRRLAKLLAANGVDYRKSGGQLGTAFVRGFEASLAGLSTQAKAILAGPRAPGTGLDADIVSPAAARRDAASANLNARQGVTDALLKESETQTGVLREILAAQTAGRGRPTTTPTAAQRGNAPTGPRP